MRAVATLLRLLYIFRSQTPQMKSTYNTHIGVTATSVSLEDFAQLIMTVFLTSPLSSSLACSFALAARLAGVAPRHSSLPRCSSGWRWRER